MDFMSRGGRQPQTSNQSSSVDSGSTPSASSSRTSKASSGGSMRYAMVGLLFSLTILLVALSVYLVVGGKKVADESKSVNSNAYQAIFLNGGQVYFGKVTALNTSFIKLSDIYYLRVNQQVQPNQTAEQAQQDVSLAKLGCELHGPEDTMVINRDQVIFWENLKEKDNDEGQVVQAIAKYKEQNPNGQKCATQNAAGSNTPATTTPAKP